MTPTEELVMEVLAARYRLGEHLWTFSAGPTIYKAFRSLEAQGLIGWKGGITEKTCRAWLTDAGKTEMLDPEYVPPILR